MAWNSITTALQRIYTSWGIKIEGVHNESWQLRKQGKLKRCESSPKREGFWKLSLKHVKFLRDLFVKSQERGRLPIFRLCWRFCTNLTLCIFHVWWSDFSVNIAKQTDTHSRFHSDEVLRMIQIPVLRTQHKKFIKVVLLMVLELWMRSYCWRICLTRELLTNVQSKVNLEL